MTSLDTAWSRVELATGIPLGVVELTELPVSQLTPRSQLGHIVLEAFERQRQVYVCFSGGRDSSAVLAVATNIARQIGAPLPVPVTLRFPAHPTTDETSWQELVVRHLDLPDWIIIERDDSDVLAPDITTLLESWGLFYPPQIGSYLPVFRAARGGTVLSGEGGDESLGGWRFRAVLHPVAWGPRFALRELAVSSLAHGPSIARRWYMERTAAVPWLTSTGRRAALDEFSKRTEAEPISWSHYLRWAFGRRSWHIARATLDRASTLDDCTIVHPLADVRLAASLVDHWNSRGPADRTTVMRTLVDDLLPGAIIEREDKATLASIFVGSASRAFIAAWNGDGVDLELVDPEALKASWLRRYPYIGSLSLLHQAWLATSSL